MNVIWHHAPGAEPVALTMKMPDGVCNDPGDAGIAHVARPEASVEHLFGMLEKGAKATFAVEDSVWLAWKGRLEAGATGLVCGVMGFAFALEPEDQFTREGVGQPKRNEVDRVGGFPMGKIAS